MVGPTRSGKGTIARVLTELVGPPNICAPSLADFGETFGLEPLLGKQLAILSDVRLDGKANHAAIAESLLKISGEDTVTVKHKFKSAWDGRLGVRFMLLSNLMPRFSDASPALANRFVPLLMDQSFLGREDHDLLTKLLPELPGILNWAIDGWRRLRERGRFNLPQSSRDAIQQLIELAAPVATFMREECELDPEGEVAKAELFDRWKNWCDRNGTLPGAFSLHAQAVPGHDPRAVVERQRGPRGDLFYNDGTVPFFGPPEATRAYLERLSRLARLTVYAQVKQPAHLERLRELLRATIEGLQSDCWPYKPPQSCAPSSGLSMSTWASPARPS